MSPDQSLHVAMHEAMHAEASRRAWVQEAESAQRDVSGGPRGEPVSIDRVAVRAEDGRSFLLPF